MTSQLAINRRVQKFNSFAITGFSWTPSLLGKRKVLKPQKKSSQTGRPEKESGDEK